MTPKIPTLLSGGVWHNSMWRGVLLDPNGCEHGSIKQDVGDSFKRGIYGSLEEDVDDPLKGDIDSSLLVAMMLIATGHMCSITLQIN